MYVKGYLEARAAAKQSNDLGNDAEDDSEDEDDDYDPDANSESDSDNSDDSDASESSDESSHEKKSENCKPTKANIAKISKVKSNEVKNLSPSKVDIVVGVKRQLINIDSSPVESVTKSMPAWYPQAGTSTVDLTL